MNRSLTAAAALSIWAAGCLAAAGQTLPSIRSVQVLPARNQVEIEIQASDRVIPHMNVLTGPDRLVVDFVNVTPSTLLRNKAVNRGEVKSLRVGLFSANPPVTRIVLDLNGPQPYQVFPAGRTVIVKIGGDAGAATADYKPDSGPVLVNTNYAATGAHLSVPTSAPAAPKPPLEVLFQKGLLSISSNKANLSEVLFAVHQQTGAEIAIPAGAEQELVAADIGPAPAPEVLAHLLNGSRFNFLILSSSSDPRSLDRVILSSRPDGPTPAGALRPMAPVVADDDEDADQARVAPVRPAPPSAQNPNPAAERPAPVPPEAKAAGDTDVPD